MDWFLYDRDLRHEKFNKDQPKKFRTKYNYVQYKYISICYIKSVYTCIIFVFSAIPWWWKALGICTEGFWNRAEFLHEVRW